MKTLRAVSAVMALVAALLLGVAGAAEAGDIFTAPLFIVDSAGDQIGCEVANPTSKSVNVTLTIFDAGGTAVATSGPLTLLAGGSTQLDHAGLGMHRCKVTTNNAGIRISLQRFNQTSGGAATPASNSDLNGYGEIVR